jgi:hypothetical protein
VATTAPKIDIPWIEKLLLEFKQRLDRIEAHLAESRAEVSGDA